jgi:hypothetical protein
MTTLHVIYDDTHRDNLITDILKANAEAMRIQRTGYTGTRGWAYAVIHDTINGLLDDLEALT